MPSPALALAGAVGWGAAMGANAFVPLWLADWASPARIARVSALFALGAAAAFPLGHVLFRLLARRDRAETRFAAAFLAFAVTTAGTTALLYALHYRVYYAQWHGDALSLEWALQLFFTTLGAFFQFSVLGLRLYFPWGAAALVLLSLSYALKAR